MKHDCLQEHGLPPQLHAIANAGIYASADYGSLKVQLTQHVRGWEGTTESTRRQQNQPYLLQRLLQLSKLPLNPSSSLQLLGSTCRGYLLCISGSGCHCLGIQQCSPVSLTLCVMGLLLQPCLQQPCMTSEVCLYEQQARCSTATAAGILTIMVNDGEVESRTFCGKESGLK